MWNKLKEQWYQFKDAEPGHRFQERYERRQQEVKDQGHSGGGKTFNLVLGCIVVVVGIFLIPAPGPGTIILFLGLSLIGSEFLPLARFLDKAELRLRPLAEKAQSLWKHTSLASKGAVGFLALVCAAGLAYGAYQMFFTGYPGS